jgi:hypothetical protein
MDTQFKMPKRIPVDSNPCVILVLGSFLSLIGVIKGLLNVLFAVLCAFVPSAFIAWWYTPQNLVQCYVTIVLTPRIGQNLKTLMFLTTWLPVVLWPILVMLCSVVGGIGVGFGVPLVSTFDDDECLLWSGVQTCYTTIVDMLNTLVKWQTVELSALREAYLRVPSLDESAEPFVPFDIPVHRLVWCIIVGLMCGLATGFMCTIILVGMLIPCTLRIYWNLWRTYLSDAQWTCRDCSWRLVFLVPFLIVNVLLIPTAILSCALMCVVSFIYSCSAGHECYLNGWRGALKSSREIVSECWHLTSVFVMEKL